MADKAPGFPCDNCGQYDWAYNTDMQRWDCVGCALYGRPMPPKPPEGNVVDPDEWTTAIFVDHEKAMRALEESKDLPDTGGVSAIMKKGKMNRAEKELMKAEARGEIADLVIMIRNFSEHSDLYFDIPDLDVKTRIKW
jgi:hypothetical protein